MLARPKLGRFRHRYAPLPSGLDRADVLERGERARPLPVLIDSLDDVGDDVNVAALVVEDHANGENRRKRGREERDLDRVLRAEPDALPFVVAIDVRDHCQDNERERRRDHAAQRRMHVQQQLLEADQVPGRLRWVGRDVQVRLVQERRVQDGRENDKRQSEDESGDELDEDEVGPDKKLLLSLAARAHATLRARCCSRARRH